MSLITIDNKEVRKLIKQLISWEIATKEYLNRIEALKNKTNA